VGDLVTIVVADRAAATSRAATSSNRTSSARAGIDALAGPIRSPRLTDLAGLSSDQKLDAAGETSRENVLTTTLAGVVTQVLPNGSLVIEARKRVQVNSEQQIVLVRGIARVVDLSPANMIRSDRLANLEIAINGKGVVGDAVRRPNFLYRLLLSVLPF
jgi:flagellar L-ring protein precursor FlgH